MIKIPQLVEQLIKEQPFLEKLLDEELINIAALARKFQSEISNRLGHPVQTGAIVMAIKRMPVYPQLHKNHKKRLSENLGDIIVRSNLADFTFANSPELMSAQSKMATHVQRNEQWFYTFSRGVFESTLILSQELVPEVERIFLTEKRIWQSFDLSAITLKLKEDNTYIPGLYYQVLKSLAWENINITEVISTTNEFTLVLNEKYIEQAFGVLKRMR